MTDEELAEIMREIQEAQRLQTAPEGQQRAEQSRLVLKHVHALVVEVHRLRDLVQAFAQEKAPSLVSGGRNAEPSHSAPLDPLGLEGVHRVDVHAVSSAVARYSVEAMCARQRDQYGIDWPATAVARAEASVYEKVSGFVAYARGEREMTTGVDEALRTILGGVELPSSAHEPSQSIPEWGTIVEAARARERGDDWGVATSEQANDPSEGSWASESSDGGVHRTLAELANEEERLERLVNEAAGTMEQKDAELRDKGVYSAYRNVHCEYVAMALASDVEAMRRAAFIQWISVIEPACVTGIAEPDREAARAVFDLLDRSVASGRVDHELAWMLPYYYQIAEWWIPDDTAPRLRQFCRSREPTGEVRPPSDFLFSGRGQMGIYWASIVK